VRIGTSAGNSHELVTHFTTRREVGDYTVFKFGYELPGGNDAIVVATRYMHTATRDMQPANWSPITGLAAA